MKHLQKICLSCHFFRPKNTENGLCRLDKSRFPDYPIMEHHGSCEEWQTSGQQYYIRAGWLKKQIEKNQEKNAE
jgi:hypothetical protein